MKIRLECFHNAEKIKDCKSIRMIEENMVEFDRFLFRCPECKREIFLKYELEDIKND